MVFEKDPIGYAIQDFAENGFSENISVMADLCDDDVMPIEYLFRNEEMMPVLEKVALSKCRGSILDVGAAAGCHAYILHKRGLDVKAIDTSQGAIEHISSLGIPAENINFYSVNQEYDTLLVLMNGIGLAGNLAGLPRFLNQIKKCLKPGGIALCDSTDLSYLYEEEDGSIWVDLNAKYHGEMQFKMRYKGVESDWFDWLYVDFELLKSYATEAGLNCELIQEGESDNYLAQLTHI
jgi:SAM-dependent methyltransferase